MRIQPIYTNQFKQFKKETQTQTQTTPVKQKFVKAGVAVGVTGMALILSRLFLKTTFEKNITNLGLEFKENILVDRSSGKNFTGKIKSKVGSLGFNKIEIREFVDGIIKEKTYNNMFGNELEGYFYNEGKKCIKVQVGYPVIIPTKKVVSVHKYDINGNLINHIDSAEMKESAFGWARSFIKKHGWDSIKPMNI